GMRGCHLNATAEGVPVDRQKQFMFSGSRWNECGRGALVWQAYSRKQDANLFDVFVGDPATAQVIQFQRSARAKVSGLSAEHLPLLDHQHFVAVVYGHGQCHWANRLEQLLHMRVVIIVQMGQCQPWYAGGLQAWKHYVPVDYHFKNVSAAVRW